jgi:LysR family transcriptional regulator (chromosome initiation inhibitor)
MLDYKLVEAVASVVLEGGFARAARALNLTQSAVSQRVKALEDELGGPLLVRGNPPRPTSLGRRLVEHCLKVRGLEGELDDRLGPGSGGGRTTVRVAVNEDSLATWFVPAVTPFLAREGALLDLVTDDQEHTLRLLRDGEAAACVAASPHPPRGCRSLPLGTMRYRCLATPDFARAWFPRGLDADGAARAPAVIYSRKDALHHAFLDRLPGWENRDFAAGGLAGERTIPAHYLPSSERFVDLVLAGLAYGMIPDQQGAPWVRQGRLVDLAPGRSMPVALHWHVWDLPSRIMDGLTAEVVRGARAALAPPEQEEGEGEVPAVPRDRPSGPGNGGGC